MTPHRAMLLVIGALNVACGSASTQQQMGGSNDPGGSGAGTTAPRVATIEVLLADAVPVQLVADAGSIYWTDDTEAPVKRANAATGEITVVARRLANPASLAIEAGRLYWSDLRSGTSPSGCSGGTSVTAMVHAALDGSDWRVAAVGDACYGASGTVVAGSIAGRHPPRWCAA